LYFLYNHGISAESVAETLSELSQPRGHGKPALELAAAPAPAQRSKARASLVRSR
jgi:hypothetical protein